MRILTVRQPWAWAIIHGGKDVENRVRNIAGDYRGPVAIHVGLAEPNMDDIRAVESCLDSGRALDWAAHMAFTDTSHGSIIGVVDLTDVHSASVIGGCGSLRHDCSEHGTCREHCSKWAMGPSEDGWFQHLVLANPRPLNHPIPYKGALGLRTLPDEIAAQVMAGLS